MAAFLMPSAPVPRVGLCRACSSVPGMFFLMSWPVCTWHKNAVKKVTREDHQPASCHSKPVKGGHHSLYDPALRQMSLFMHINGDCKRTAEPLATELCGSLALSAPWSESARSRLLTKQLNGKPQIATAVRTLAAVEANTQDTGILMLYALHTRARGSNGGSTQLQRKPAGGLHESLNNTSPQHLRCLRGRS